jgi:hypothetical protein
MPLTVVVLRPVWIAVGQAANSQFGHCLPTAVPSGQIIASSVHATVPVVVLLSDADIGYRFWIPRYATITRSIHIITDLIVDEDMEYYDK